MKNWCGLEVWFQKTQHAGALSPVVDWIRIPGLADLSLVSGTSLE